LNLVYTKFRVSQPGVFRRIGKTAVRERRKRVIANSYSEEGKKTYGRWNFSPGRLKKEAATGTG